MDSAGIGAGTPVAATGNPERKPTGNRTYINPNESDETKRSLRRENESADLLALLGYKIEQTPPAKANKRRPDYKIEGEYFDNYAPTIGPQGQPKSVARIWTKIRDKVRKKQADRIVLNLDDWHGDTKSLGDQFRRRKGALSDLQELIVLKDGQKIEI